MKVRRPYGSQCQHIRPAKRYACREARLRQRMRWLVSRLWQTLMLKRQKSSDGRHAQRTVEPRGPRMDHGNSSEKRVRQPPVEVSCVVWAEA